MSAKSLGRIAAQQRLMQRLAEARLVRIAAEVERVGAREAAIVEAACDGGALGRVFAASAGPRLLSLARERAGLDAQRAQTRDTLLHHARLASGADRMAARRGAEADIERRRADLAAIVETIGQGPGKADGPD